MPNQQRRNILVSKKSVGGNSGTNKMVGSGSKMVSKTVM